MSSLYTYQKHAFESQFRSRFTNDFEFWFGELAKLLFPTGDIQSPRLTQGDGKIDVYVVSEQIVYQCYAPQNYSTSDAAGKIKQDFHGAMEFLEGKINKWVFVHNHPTGQLDKNGIKALNEIKAECAEQGLTVEILAWGFTELWVDLEMFAPYEALRQKFGEADPIVVDFATIEGLLHSLERAEYPINVTETSLPSSLKLDYNKLGVAYRLEIENGRKCVDEVRRYLISRTHSNPEFGEQMAEHFRKRYDRLKGKGILTPDEIYDQLRLDAGWNSSPNAKREMATRAILAYFFDSCDIFENPPPQ